MLHAFVSYLRYYTNCLKDVKHLAQTSQLRTVPIWLVCAKPFGMSEIPSHTGMFKILPYRCLCYVSFHYLRIYLGKFDMIEVVYTNQNDLQF